MSGCVKVGGKVGFRYTIWCNKTRQGYALKRTLKLAGYFLVGRDA